jgi:hypothetical protein
MEETKVCSRCKKELGISDFSKRSGGKYLQSFCIDCNNEYLHEYYLTNKNKMNTSNKKYRDLHKDEIQSWSKEWRDSHKEEIKISQKQHRNRANKEEVKRYNKKYREIPRNKAKRNERQKILSQNPEFKIRNAIRKRIRDAIFSQYGKKSCKSMDLLGCSVDECRNWLESRFLPKMTWDNYGDWHIDHILPCASFDLTNPEEQKKCFHYTNLQPLWATDNASKRDKIEVFTSEGVFWIR